MSRGVAGPGPAGLPAGTSSLALAGAIACTAPAALPAPINKALQRGRSRGFPQFLANDW